MADDHHPVRAQPSLNAAKAALAVTLDMDLPPPPPAARGKAQMEAGSDPARPSLLARFHAGAPQYRKSLFRR